MIYFFMISSIWLLVGVTFMRLVIVRAPLTAKSSFTTPRALVGVAAIIGSSFMVNFPHFFNYYPNKVNGTHHILETDYARTGGNAR